MTTPKTPPPPRPTTHQLKNPPVHAEQFYKANTPWPDGVDACELGDGSPHLHLHDDIVHPVTDSDWILTHPNQSQQVLTDEVFQAQYEVLRGPPR
jgi:hypothetical protein